MDMMATAYTARETSRCFAFFGALRDRGLILDFNPEDAAAGVIGVWIKHRGAGERSTYLTISKYRRRWLYLLHRTRFLLEAYGTGPVGAGGGGLSVARSLSTAHATAAWVIGEHQEGRSVELMSRTAAAKALNGNAP